MGLYHVNYEKVVKPENAEENDYLQLLRSNIPNKTWDKMVRIFDERIAEISPTKSTELTFGMLASLVGYKSLAPTADSTYVWEKVWKAAGEDQKTANYMLGTLAQWRFACDDRDWLCYKKESGRLNSEGEEMAVTIYWVNDKSRIQKNG